MRHSNLWAPWRAEYIQQLGPEEAGAKRVCFLCEGAGVTAGSDEASKRLVIVRDGRGVILLNRYPYTNGHLLVAPSEHLADLGELGADQRGSLMELAALAQEILRVAINPQGFNIGANLGSCAGAGLPGHLHFHVVPRWGGDTNFMQAVGQVRVIPQAIEQSFSQLTQAYEKIAGC